MVNKPLFFLLKDGTVVTRRDVRMAYKISGWNTTEEFWFNVWASGHTNIVRPIDEKEISIEQFIRSGLRIRATQRYRGEHLCSIDEAKSAIAKIEAEIRRKDMVQNGT